ncbi:MAG: hypothetical protein RDV41_09650 [Planctomycetota bacterium]|nr:hypothetical protein [Planctomycetota bacterium]
MRKAEYWFHNGRKAGRDDVGMICVQVVDSDKKPKDNPQALEKLTVKGPPQAPYSVEQLTGSDIFDMAGAPLAGNIPDTGEVTFICTAKDANGNKKEKVKGVALGPVKIVVEIPGEDPFVRTATAFAVFAIYSDRDTWDKPFFDAYAHAFAPPSPDERVVLGGLAWQNAHLRVAPQNAAQYVGSIKVPTTYRYKADIDVKYSLHVYSYDGRVKVKPVIFPGSDLPGFAEATWEPDAREEAGMEIKWHGLVPRIKLAKLPIKIALKDWRPMYGAQKTVGPVLFNIESMNDIGFVLRAEAYASGSAGPDQEQNGATTWIAPTIRTLELCLDPDFPF